MSLTTDRMAAALDKGLDDVTHVQWSEDGSEESSNLDRTSVSLTSATEDDPSVVENDAEIETDGASGSCTITHFAFAGGTDGDTRRTTWIELDSSRDLESNDTLVADAGNLKEELHQATSAP